MLVARPETLEIAGCKDLLTQCWLGFIGRRTCEPPHRRSNAPPPGGYPLGWVILWCMDRDGLLDDKWSSVDSPVLKAVVARMNAASYPAVQTYDIAEDTGLDRAEVVRSVTRLVHADFIDAEDASTEASKDWTITGCSEKAQVITGVWPSPERLIARLEGELEKEIDDAPEGSAKHRKLSALLESLKNIAEGTTSAVLTEVVLRATGMKA